MKQLSMIVILLLLINVEFAYALEHSAFSNVFELDTYLPPISMQHSALSNVFTLDTGDYIIEIFDMDAFPQNTAMMAKAEDLKVTAIIENKNQSGESKVDFECFAVNKDNTRTDMENKSITLKAEEKSVVEFYTDKLPRIFEGTIKVRAKSTSSNEASQDVNIYYTPFKFGKDNYSFTNDKAYAQNLSIKDLVSSFFASGTSLTENVFQIAPLYCLFGMAMTFLNESEGYCYGFAATSILYRDYPELKVYGKDDVTYQYNREDEKVRYKIQEYFKTQIPYLTADILDGKPNLKTQYIKAVDFIKNQNKPVLLVVPQHAVTAYKTIQIKDKSKIYYYDNARISDMNPPRYGIFDGKFAQFRYKDENMVTDEIYFRYPEITIKDEVKSITQRINQFVLDKLRNEKKSLVVAASPVDTLLTDENGRRIGYANGISVNEIPGAEIKEVDSVEIFLVPSGTNYQVKSVGISNGTFDLYSIMEKKDGNMEEMVYEKVPVNKNSVATVKLGSDINEYQMKIDLNGDQVIDSIEQPDYVFNPSNIYKNPYDINQDGIVNILDMVIITKNFGKVGNNVIGDVNGDGKVDKIDLDMLTKHFGEKIIN